MAWQSVVIDPSKQDQITATATVNDRQQVTAITEQCIITYIAVDAGAATPGSTVPPQTYAAYSASDPTSGLTVPAIGASVTIDGTTGWIVTQVMPRRTGPFTFEIQVTCTWKYNVQPEGQSKWNINLKFGGQKTTQQAYHDKDNNDVVNTAGQAYDPSVNETIYDEVLNISYSTLDPPDLDGLRGMVNSDGISFTISGLSRSYTERQLLLEDGDIATTLTLQDGSTPVWNVNLTFVNRQDTWIDTILDQGYYQLNSSGVLVPVTDHSGNSLNAPALLDSAGKQLASGGTPHYSTFKIEGETALSSLFDGLS